MAEVGVAAIGGKARRLDDNFGRRSRVLSLGSAGHRPHNSGGCQKACTRHHRFPYSVTVTVATIRRDVRTQYAVTYDILTSLLPFLLFS